jgi:6,7-dimethyl-8-ribityllumazine synthase
MSNAASPRARDLAGKASFGIVASEFNANFVDGLVSHAMRELRAQAPEAEIRLIRVPGAFEIPVVVKEIARDERFEAILAIGVILKGQTDHAEHLARSVTGALQRIAVEHSVPVINCVLSLSDEQQAHDRCLGEKINRGTEAASAALKMAHVMGRLRAPH